MCIGYPYFQTNMQKASSIDDRHKRDVVPLLSYKHKSDVNAYTLDWLNTCATIQKTWREV